MALSEEFEEYLATGVSPKARGLLRKAALKMPQERRAGFLASLQQADFEFQVPVQDRMPEGAANIKPSRFRHHDFDIPSKSMNLNLKGRYVPPGWGDAGYGASQKVKEAYKKYNPPEQQVNTREGTYFFPNESDTVNTYGLGNNPSTIAHEYRHRQDLEGLPGEGSEYLNKVQDLLGATNESELRKSLRGMVYTFERTMVTDEEAQSFAVEIDNLARDPDTSLEELAAAARYFLNHYMTKNLMFRSTMRSDKNIRGAERVGRDAPFKDRISPDDFRRSDFYKTDIKEQSWLDKLKGAMRN